MQVQVLSSAPKQLVNAVCIYELFVFMVDIFTDVRSSSPVICTIPSVLTGLKRFCMTLGFLFVLIVKTEYIIKTTDSFTASVCTNDIFIVLFSRINDILQHRYVSRKTAYGWY